MGLISQGGLYIFVGGGLGGLINGGAYIPGGFIHLRKEFREGSNGGAYIRGSL